VYNDAYHIIKTNTPSPRISHSSSIRGFIDFGTTYTISRTRHRTAKQSHLDLSRYRVEKIPAYVPRSNLNKEQLQINQQSILYNLDIHILDYLRGLGQDSHLQTQPIFHA